MDEVIQPANGNTSDVTNDPVNHPAHYCRNGVELIDIIDSLPYCRGAAIKYIYRAGAKDPAKEVEDLRKAAWMIEREIQRLTAASRKNGKKGGRPRKSTQPL